MGGAPMWLLFEIFKVQIVVNYNGKNIAVLIIVILKYRRLGLQYRRTL